ncbi:Putative conserved exported protein precursor [Legionella beliardensis]|uniref:Conserved exported protein n=1 Tax=Legionella beliardensis TaxID=91822 RepID=A0A378HYH1_9GAMM|nr:UPF0149 family protein [Legionella beliardensis]STX27520.1 Putative conserved exported protein precursor [Legionella beliardensis]
MPIESNLECLPSYQDFADRIAILSLPISSSELHGVMCGYLCAGSSSKAETYLQALTLKAKKDELTRTAALAIFDTYVITQQQINNFDFTFQLLLPAENAPLIDRAQAFSQWCEGFTQGITLSGVNYELLEEDESREALQHIVEFAQLDYDSLSINEDDEKALMEISEYTRMAVLRLSADLHTLHTNDSAKH